MSRPPGEGGPVGNPHLQASAAVRLSPWRPAVRITPSFWHKSSHPRLKQHAVLLGLDSWMRPNDCAYRTPAPRSGDDHAFGDLTLSHPGRRGAAGFAPGFTPPAESFHLLDAGDTCISLSHDHRFVAVTLVRSRSSGAPVLAGFCLVDMLPVAANFSTDKQRRCSSREHAIAHAE